VLSNISWISWQPSPSMHALARSAIAEPLRNTGHLSVAWREFSWLILDWSANHRPWLTGLSYRLHRLGAAWI
jgi:hypothetical protein